MTVSNVATGGSAPALVGLKQQARDETPSRDAWLHQLEQAQVQVRMQSSVGAHQQDAQQSSGGMTNGIFEQKQPAPVVQTLADLQPIQKAVIPDENAVVMSKVAEALPTAQSIADARSISPNTPLAFLTMTTELESAVPAPQNASSMGGRETLQYAASAMRLFKSSHQEGEQTVMELAVRDAGMTLQDELNLSATMRETLKDTGARLGAVWLNGRLVNK